MRWIYCAILLLVISKSQAQKISYSEKRATSFTYVKGNGFEGVIFSKDFVFPFLENESGDKRFTPTNEEIEIAENILNKNLQSVNVLQTNQGDGKGPVIHEGLKQFVRQYFGYYNATGEKIIYISCLFKANYNHTSKQTPNWLKGAVIVLNGGSNYWQIQANLNKSTLFGLSINNLDKHISP